MTAKQYEIIFFTIIFSAFVNVAFTQNKANDKTDIQSEIKIKVPDFADREIKTFYTSYANHLIKCIDAIRKKNEAKATALFKNPGEQLVAREKILAIEIVKDDVEKQKYMQFAAEVYPYIKELERSPYYQKLYGGKIKE